MNYIEIRNKVNETTPRGAYRNTVRSRMSVKVNNIDDIAFIFSFKEIAKRAKVWKETLECACNLFEHEFGCVNCPLL